MFKQFSFPTWIPKPTNIEQNSIPRSLLFLISSLNRFLITFCSQLLPPEHYFSSPRCSHSTISQKSHFEVDLAFCPYFGADLAPLSLQKTNKILPKFLPKTHLNLNQFLYRFQCHVGSIWELQIRLINHFHHGAIFIFQYQVCTTLIFCE